MQVRVYKELSSFTPKVVGPFTLRQFCAVVACVPVCYMIIRTFWGVLGKDITVILAAIPAVIAFAFGWLKPYGMTIEKFLGLYIKTRLLPPYRRKYIVENTIVNSVADADAAWEREQLKAAGIDPKKKKHMRKKKQAVPDGALL